MITSTTAAQYLLTLSEPDEGDLISNRLIQKLVYYAQGIHLALYDEPLFLAEIYAWAQGPVVPSLFSAYPDSGPIPVPENFDLTSVPEPANRVLDEVWNVYGQYSAWRLREMTQSEPPWKETPIGKVITREALKTYFKTLIDPPRPCYECGGDMTFRPKATTLTYKGHTTSVITEAWWCTSCDEGILEGQSSIDTENALMALKAEVDSADPPPVDPTVEAAKPDPEDDPEIKTCPGCGEAAVDSRIEDTSFPFGFDDVPVTLQVYFCKKCGEEFLDSSSEEAKQKALRTYLGQRIYQRHQAVSTRLQALLTSLKPPRQTQSDAAISGSARIAFIPAADDTYWCVSPSGSRRLIPRGEAPHLIGDAKDLEFVTDSDEAAILKSLREACAAVDVIHLTLMLVDPTTSKAAVALALKELEAVLTDPKVVERAKRVLLAQPLPAEFSVERALTRANEGSLVRQFITELKEATPMPPCRVLVLRLGSALVAQCVDLNLNGQGSTVLEALNSLLQVLVAQVDRSQIEKPLASFETLFEKALIVQDPRVPPSFSQVRLLP